MTGWSGFLGRRVADDLVANGYDVRLAGRDGPDARWDHPDSLVRAVDGADLVVNLAGKSVNCRYTDRNRDEILRSRIATTEALRQAIERAATPPRCWLNASTATIYRSALDRPMTEADGELGTGFSVDVAASWERTFFAGELPGTRRAALRMAIVLGGPATDTLERLVRLGLGGAHYDGWWFPHRRYRGIGVGATAGDALGHRSKGRQRFSWIHVDDVERAIRFIADDGVDGVVNLAAPNPSDDRTLMSTIRNATGVRVGLPSTRWMLEPAMWALRTEPELLLKSRWVLPERLEQAGFGFRWPELEPAIRDVVGS